MIPDNVPRKQHRDTLLALTAFIVTLLLCIILSPPNVEGVDVSTFSTGQGSKSSLTVEFTPDVKNFHTRVYLDKGAKVHDFSLSAKGYPRNGQPPTDLSLDVHGDDSKDWSRKGELNGTVEIHGGGIVEAFNSYVLGGGNGTRQVTLTFSSSTEGFLNLSSLEITYNLAPSVNEGTAPNAVLPSVTLFEDNFGSQSGINLMEFFSDPEGDPLTFSLKGLTKIVGSVDANTRMATFTAPENWTGSETFRVVASDPFGASAEAELTVVINATKGLPRIISSSPGADNVTIDEGEETTFEVEVDNPDGGAVTYEWYKNGEAINGAVSPEYVFSPSSEDRGSNVILVKFRTGKVWKAREWSVEVKYAEEDDGVGKEEERSGQRTILVVVIAVLLLLAIGSVVAVVMIGRRGPPLSRFEPTWSEASEGAGPGAARMVEDRPKRIEVQKEETEKATREITVDESVRCQVCNDDLLDHDNAYMCNICDSLFHLDCVIGVCPDCGEDTSECLSPVAVKVTKRRRGGRKKATKNDDGWMSVSTGAESHSVGRSVGGKKREKKGATWMADEEAIEDEGPGEAEILQVGWGDDTSEFEYVGSLPRPNICIVCRKMLKKGREAQRCPDCGRYLHVDCSEGLERCPDCGN